MRDSNFSQSANMKSQMNLQFNLDHENEGHEMQDEDAIRLESRMEEFKQDPEKMEALNEFLDEVLMKAQTEVESKSASKVVSGDGRMTNSAT